MGHVTKGYFANADIELSSADGVAVPNSVDVVKLAEGTADVAIVVVGAGNSESLTPPLVSAICPLIIAQLL